MSENESPETYRYTVDLKFDEQALRGIRERLEASAREALGPEPFTAACQQTAANILRCLRGEEPKAKPMRNTRATATTPGKLKHKYNSAGFCALDHGDGICGLQRQRKPRAGSVASATSGTLPGQTSIEERVAVSASHEKVTS